MKKPNVTAERLRQELHYEPSTGQFTRVVACPGMRAGSPAGNMRENGYVRICVDQRDYRAHRLAWLYMTGEWPEQDVDHINGNRSDNRWLNLRSATRAVNCQNRRKAHSNNKSTGILGVSKDRGRFAANIFIDGKKLYLGRYRTADEAEAVYLQAKRKHHPGCTL